MPLMTDASQAFTLLRDHGGTWYGQESVTQLQHACQCAHLAEREAAPPHLVIAALLHDLGHLVHQWGEDAAVRGINDGHEVAGAQVLTQLFGSRVATPVRLHVAAKRWLCARESGYWEALSPASQHSLELQGGVFTTAQADEFIQLPQADEAIRLRRWDDSAKDPAAVTPTLDYYSELARQLLLDMP